MPNIVSVTVTGKNDSQRALTQTKDSVRDVGTEARQAGTHYDRLLTTVGQTDDVARRAFGGAERTLDNFDRSVRRTDEHLDDLGDSAGGAGKRLSSALGEEASGAADGLMDKLGPLGGVLGKLGPAGAAAGAAIGVALAGAAVIANRLHDALQRSMERTKAAARIGAQLGLDTPEQLGQLGRVSAKVYADNFADSLESAATAVRDVLRNGLVPEDATDEAVTRLAEKLATVADLFEEDTVRLSGTISQLLRTGLVKTADEALDLLTRGLQEGADKSQDLLDTLNEYPTQFRKLGLSGQQALGLMVQGVRAGARDSDIVADAFKEFAIRAVDGSKLTADGFKMIGLNAKTMANDIGAGGERANKALDLTLDRLRAIEDPVKRGQAAVALFGTQAEDLGDALFALDPSAAAQRIGKLEGAADRAATALGDNLGSRLETLRRKVEMSAADLGDKLVPVVGRVIDKLEAFAHWVGPILQDALQFLRDRIEENRDGLEDFMVLMKDLEPVIKILVTGAIITLAGSVGLLIEFIAELGRSWERAKDVAAVFTLALLDGFGRILEGAADAFGWIPVIGGDILEARDKFQRFAEDVKASLEGIPDQEINVRVDLEGVERIGSLVQRAVGANLVSHGLGQRRAAGGPTGAGWTFMNELGAEAVKLPTGSMVLPAGATQAMTGGAQQGAGMRGPMPVEMVGASDSALGALLTRLARDGFLRIPRTAIVER